MKPGSLVLFLVFLGLFCGNAFSRQYSRIISLAPSLTKNIYYLEAGDQLVGCTSYCEIPEGEQKAIVASAVKVSLEKIVTLDPDLIILMPLTSPETIDFIEKLGIHTEVFPSPKDFREICDQFLYLGKLLGKEELAQKIVEDASGRVDRIRMEDPVAEGKKVFFQIGANPIFSVLPNTFMNDFILFIGAENIADDLKGGIIGRETVLVRDPDIIFVATMGVLGDEERKIWKSYTSMSASKTDQIFTIDSDLACLPTPVTFAGTLEIMVELLKTP